MSEQHLERELRKAQLEAEKEKARVSGQGEVLETEPSHEVGAKVARKPYTPNAQERELHESTHTPYRNWCTHCVQGLAPDSKHAKTVQPDDAIPTIHFDYADGSGKTSDPESKITLLMAHESLHGSIMATQIRKKGSSDEYVVQAFLNWIST